MAFEKSSETEEVVDARFWDALTTFQYLGFLSIDEKNDKVTKLDFALSSVCNKHSIQSHAGSYSALRQLGNDLAQDNLPLRKNTHALREQDGAFPQASRRCE